MAEAVFGKRLAALRKAAGLTQAALAKLSGMSLPGIRGLEQGQRGEPNWTTVQLLARALKLSCDEFATLPKRK